MNYIISCLCHSDLKTVGMFETMESDNDEMRICTGCRWEMPLETCFNRKGRDGYTKMCTYCLNQIKQRQTIQIIDDGKIRTCPKCKLTLELETNFKPIKKGYTKLCLTCLEKIGISGRKRKCIHGRTPERCAECGGSAICPCGRQKYSCRKCRGKSICLHGRFKPSCLECGGISICKHGRREQCCRDCKGTSICEHDRRKGRCKICDPLGHLAHLSRSAVERAVKSDAKMKHSMEYIGCNTQMLKKHIEQQFKPGMTWENHGKIWHIDHKIPLKYREGDNKVTQEELISRLHYTNLQPLWAEENISKGNRYIG